jgi:hypothetical protein
MNGQDEPIDQDESLDEDELFDDDLIDRIANFLPLKSRAGFYRELRYCRSLPQNDEVLRLIRAMQYLVLIMVKLPEQMAQERERFELIVSRCEKLLDEVHHFVDESTKQIDERLAQVSSDIAKALNPKTVAAEINESLRQQFIKTTIPETADALAVNAAQIKKATSDFVSATDSLNNAYDGAVVKADRAIQSLETTSSQAITGNKRQADELMAVVRQDYRWLLFALPALCILIGIGLSFWYHRWIGAVPR